MWIFVPVGIESAGTWNHQAVELVQELGRRMTAVTEDTREATYLFQRMSVALQLGNAVSFHSTLPPSKRRCGLTFLKTAKFSHTRYRALGPELIPMYRQSARRRRKVNHAIDLAVGCRYFLPGLRLPP